MNKWNEFVENHYYLGMIIALIIALAIAIPINIILAELGIHPYQIFGLW